MEAQAPILLSPVPTVHQETTQERIDRIRSHYRSDRTFPADEVFSLWLRGHGSLRKGAKTPGEHAGICIWYDKKDRKGKFGTKLPRIFLDGYSLRRFLVDNAPENVQIKSDQLVFDVDLNAYAPFRFCGCGKESRVCPTCWGIYARGSMIIINHFCRDVMGYQDLQFVFSGRRGFHCWVLDREADSLCLDVRRAITRSWFPEGGKDGWDPRDEFVRDMIDRVGIPMFESCKESAELCSVIARERRLPSEQGQPHITLCRMIWPRLDPKVTGYLEHGVRCPFSLNITTGRCARPLSGPDDNPFAGEGEARDTL